MSAHPQFAIPALPLSSPPRSPGQLKHYPPHRRLLFQAVAAMPRLELMADPLPPALYSGELCRWAGGRPACERRRCADVTTTAVAFQGSFPCPLQQRSHQLVITIDPASARILPALDATCPPALPTRASHYHHRHHDPHAG